MGGSQKKEKNRKETVIKYMHFYTVAVVLQKQYKTYGEKSTKIKRVLNISHKNLTLRNPYQKHI